MRLALAFLVIPAIAYAEQKPTVVWQNRVIGAPGMGGALPASPIKGRSPGIEPSALTSVSHKLYLNDCMPSGCTVSPGADNSLTNRSSIPQSTVTLDAYSHGTDSWNQLVACVRDTFKPFDIEITEVDPGSVSHFEVMIGGTSRQLNPNLDAGGVAPFISCGATRDNAISFVFASQTGSIDYLCAAVAQEASHIWGLDHELDAKDPMTYLDLGSSKRFQNSDPDCGEDTPRHCRCGGSTQNSFRYMNNTFGLSSTLVDPTLAIGTPTEGQWVRPHFPISATLTSDLSLLDAALSIDGAQIETANSIIAFNAPDLAAGPHAIALSATDVGDRTVMGTVNVKVLSTCSAATACPSSFSCLGGLCLPGSNEAGGLGASCASNGECITGQCASDGTDSLCTGGCDAGTCPSGFACLAEANVCWPDGSASSGCSTSGGDFSGFALVGLGAFVIVARRRRR